MIIVIGGHLIVNLNRATTVYYDNMNTLHIDDRVYNCSVEEWEEVMDQLGYSEDEEGIADAAKEVDNNQWYKTDWA